MTFVTHFYADPHFGHEGVIAHANRPFVSVPQMDASLESYYRDEVTDDDCVVFVGDFSFHDNLMTRDLVARLPGKKILVRGNHDGKIARCLKLGFDIVVDFMHLQIAGHKVTVSHYPPAGATKDERYPERRPMKPPKGDFILHGHTHEFQKRIGRRIHVGVDAWDYKPARIEDVAALIVGDP